MARLSKSHQFAIHEDAYIPAQDPTSDQPLESISNSEDKIQTAVEELEHARCLLEENADSLETLQEERCGEGHLNKRRSSIVSAYPESAYQSDHDVGELPEHPHTPLNRPNLRQIDALQKLQILSAPQLGFRSPRRQWTRQVRSKNGTPKALRLIQSTGSPKRRRRISEQTEAQEEEVQPQYPLVLLHVTLLPMHSRWSEQNMRENLPASVLDQIKVLKTKISATLLSRGILIQHPQEEYDLLEERILETLELQEERVTKCGHFRGRESVSSSNDSDSGVGSSVEDCNDDICTTCKRRIKTSKSGVGHRDKRWLIKVFAANGLLRASAWAAAWSDMESVDVEILPWISEDLQRQLDERAVQEDTEEATERREADEDRIRRIVDEQVELMRKKLNRESDPRARARKPSHSQFRDSETHLEAAQANETAGRVSECVTPRLYSRDMPQVYPPSDVPLSILLWNYVYLLARDWRNVAILVLGILTLSSALLFVARKTPDSHSMLPSIETSDPIQVVSRKTDPGVINPNDQVQEENERKEAVVESPKFDGYLFQDICPLNLMDLFTPILREEESCPIGLED